MIRLNCFIRVKADKKEEVLTAAQALTEASLRQDGCVAYDIFTSATRPDVMMICETWKDQSTLDLHTASEEFKKYVSEIEAGAEMKLERFEF
ncbi:MAG: putative quinol monooxygenase [Lepagella sp.]